MTSFHDELKRSPASFELVSSGIPVHLAPLLHAGGRSFRLLLLLCCLPSIAELSQSA
jgi:hypothetical protein